MTADPRDLILTRLIDVPRATLWRCWTEADLIKKWFTPPPFTVPYAEMDVRAGGKSCITMRGPDGKDIPMPGTYLEVVKNEKLVFTDAYVGDWEPGQNKPFMTGVISFADEAGQTRYIARVRHWSMDDRENHEKMGFHTGWGIATDQLTALAKTL